MPLPPVIVEISAEDASMELRGTLIDACSRAVLDGACVEGMGAASAKPGAAAAVAIVSWQPDGTVRIEVGLRPDEPWHTRILRFAEEEEPAEEFTAVGFAIGALVGRLQEEEKLEPPDSQSEPEEVKPEPPPPAPPESPPVAPPIVRPEPDSPSSGWRGTLAAIGGTGRTWSTWRIGATFGIAWAHSGGALLGASGTYAVSPRPEGEPRENWTGFGVGPGYDLRLGKGLSLEFSGELGAELHSAEVTVSQEFDKASHWLGVGRVGAKLVGPTSSPLAATFGVGLTAPFVVTRINVAGVPQQEPAPFRLTGLIGVRYDARNARERSGPADGPSGDAYSVSLGEGRAASRASSRAKPSPYSAR